MWIKSSFKIIVMKNLIKLRSNLVECAVVSCKTFGSSCQVKDKGGTLHFVPQWMLTMGQAGY